MKRFIIIQLLAVVFAAQIQAQGDGEIKYRRSSLYSMMINHEGREFGDEIKDVFLKIPVPDKYNNHDLSVKVIYTSEKKLDKNHEEIDEFIRNNGIASRMVGRWFNRDYMTGICDVELVKERGLYNASELDKALASKTQRGNALLETAGEDTAHRFGRLALGGRGHMGVGVQGKPRREVPQHSGYRFHVHPVLEGQGGKCVTQIVEPHSR